MACNREMLLLTERVSALGKYAAVGSCNRKLRPRDTLSLEGHRGEHFSDFPNNLERHQKTC
jgi:hypothetical protein